MHLSVRDNRLESEIGNRKNALFYKKINSTSALASFGKDSMETFLGLLFIIAPVLFAIWYSNYEYGMSISDNLKHWKTGKLIAVVSVVLYVFYILSVGVIEFVHELEGWLVYFIDVGVAISLIIFCKPASEILDDYEVFRHVNMHEDVAFIIGWLILLYTYLMVFIYAL
jgi:hypothetical protein